MDSGERFKIEIYQKSFERVNIDDFYELIKMFSLKEAYINKGDFSKVYRDIMNQSCYKVLTRPDQIRNAKEEADLLKEVKDVNNLNFGRVPIPLFSIMPTKELKEGDIFKHGAFAMQLIDGVRLKDVIEKKVPLTKNFEMESFFDKLYFLIEVIQKQKNIFHRDVNAGNIMIENQTGLPYLIDFGNSIKLSQEKIDKKIDPYHLIIKGKPVHLLNDFKGLEIAKEETKKFLTKR